MTIDPVEKEKNGAARFNNSESYFSLQTSSLGADPV
jgi:hypothetical protein